MRSTSAITSTLSKPPNATPLCGNSALSKAKLWSSSRGLWTPRISSEEAIALVWLNPTPLTRIRLYPAQASPQSTQISYSPCYLTTFKVEGSLHRKDIEPDNQKRLVRMFRVLCQMMQVRGYNVTDQKRNILDHQIIQKHSNAEKCETFLHLTNQNKHCAVFLNKRRNKISVNYVNDMLRIIDNDSIRLVIFVVTDSFKGSLNKRCIQLAQTHRNEKKEIEFLAEEHLLFNVLKHELVPQHIPLNAQEKQDLLLKYKIKESQLPKLLLSDPVSLFLGLKRGEVVKILRKSQTAGTYISYRVVV